MRQLTDLRRLMHYWCRNKDLPGCTERRSKSVQALRAAAALSIAVLHVLHDATSLDPGGMIERWHDAVPWGAGVDLFFVISGFVMVYASNDLFGRRDGPALFMARRLIQIVPLYWAATTLFLLWHSSRVPR